MKRYLLLAAFAAPTLALGKVSPVISAADAAHAFAERKSLCRREQGRLWGYDLCGPMMFVDPATRQAVLNESVPNAVKDGDVYRTTLPKSVSPANTAFAYLGRRWSMVLWPLPKDRVRRDILLMHESYHRLQPRLGFVGGSGLGENGHLDTRAGRVWLRAELHALRAALKADDGVRRTALRDALRFRAYRRSLWPRAAEQERALELNEGLAESTGVDAAVPTPAGRVKAALEDIARIEKDKSYVRSFAYATGPAYAELLDAVQPTWRRSVDKSFDIGRLAAKAYGLTLPRPEKAAAMLALRRYDGDTILSQEKARAKAIAARDARYTPMPLRR